MVVLQRQCLVQSYISPKARIKKSPIHGKGLFAVRQIKKGEIVAIKGGHIMNERELKESEALYEMTFFQIEEGFYIGAREKSEVKHNKLFMNHSCDPNVGYRGQIVFVAMREIKAGEELTFDWAMGTDESNLWKDWEIKCNCGSANCRKVLTPHDWRIKELQRRYGDYCSPFILNRIRNS